MRKKGLSAILISVLLFGTCAAVLAAETKGEATGEHLKSHGRIVYQNDGDRVVIDSDDLYMLADRLDLFKRGVADQLNSINTYFTREEGISLKTEPDVHVVHAKPSGESTVDPMGIGFDTLLEGIAASQSVPSDVTAASVDNLSAGTAAWVNGELLLGTGEDNRRYYQSGYEEGRKTGRPKITASVKLDQDDKHGWDLYLGNQEYVIITGTSNLTTDPAPVWRYDDTGFSLLRYKALSDGGSGFVHIPYLHSPSGAATMMFYLNYN